MQAHNKMSTLLKLDCADKKAHHPDALSPGVMPFHPSVVVAAGRKGSGKGATVKQLLMLAAPAYDKIYICHYDQKTEEWNDVDPTKIFSINDLPSDPTEFLDRSEKNALVIDEIPFEGMNRANKGKIDRVVNYMCTHYSCTVFLLQQNLVSIPPAIRRAADWLIMWPSTDRESQRYVSRLTGHDMAKLSKLCKTKHDSVCFDFSKDGPELRLNLFTPIKQS
jgi:hypothetical protein